MRILFDATRLAQRRGLGSPTGIDRVVLAYGRWLAAHPAVDLAPVISSFGRLTPMPRATFDRLIGPAPSTAPAKPAPSTAPAKPAPSTASRSPSPRGGGEGLAFSPPFSSPSGGSPAEGREGGRPGEAGRGAGALGLLSRRLSVAGRFLKSRLAARQSGDLYLNVGHSGLDRPGFLAALAASGLPIAVMIHDLIPITHPEFCAPAAGGRHLRRLEATLTHARLIITNSRATADEVAAFARGHDLPLPTLCPAPLGVEAAFLSPSSSPFSSPFSSPPGGSPAEGREGGGGSPAEGREGGRGEDPPTGVTGFTVNAAAAEPYFVVVGTIEARKNLAFLLTLWRRLDEAMGEAAPRLFLVGRRGWENEAVLDHLERSQSARRLAIEAPGLSDAELARLMAGARALLAPSLAEGFDLPVAEARALGVPVIGSDIPVHRELAPGAKLIDPLDGPGWLAAIEAASFTPLSQRCHPAASTWADHFSKVRGALGLPSGPAAPQPVGG